MVAVLVQHKTAYYAFAIAREADASPDAREEKFIPRVWENRVYLLLSWVREQPVILPEHI
jgi:hypothetical protein